MKPDDYDWVKRSASGYPPRRPAMRDIFQLANQSPLVRSCIKMWEAGEITLETALIMAVLYLADLNDRLTDDVLLKMKRNPFVATMPRSDVEVTESGAVYAKAKPDAAQNKGGSVMVMPAKMAPNILYSIGPCPKCGRSFAATGNPPVCCGVAVPFAVMCPSVPLRTVLKPTTPDDRPTLET